MNENLETSIDGLSDSCSSCCLSQNIIESLKQRIEKLEKEPGLQKHLNIGCSCEINEQNEDSINIKQMKEKIQILTEKTRDQHIIISQNFQIQHMQLVIAEKDKQISEIKTCLNNQSKEEELEAFLHKENKLFKEKYLEKFNENIKLNKQLEEINIEMSKIKEKHKLTLTELSKYKEENQDLSSKYLNEKSENEKKFNDILEEFNQMKLENTNFINKLKESDEKINKNNKKIDKLEQTNASLQDKISELSSQLNLLNKNVAKKLRYVNLPNKIYGIYSSSCCEKLCVYSDTIASGVCESLNGYINVNDGKIKYHNNKENNKYIDLYAQCVFTKDKGYLSNSSLFYFEVKMIKEQTEQLSYAMIGVKYYNNAINKMILLSNYTESINQDYNHKFSWNDGDIFGCGVVFPPKDKENNEHIYVFFTKNGNRIGSEIVLEGFNSCLYPIVGLLCCSAETNFGNDLVGKPFCYDISLFI